MWTVSKVAMEQVLQDIRNGVQYPDRWPETDEQETMEEKPYTRWWEEDEDEQA